MPWLCKCVIWDLDNTVWDGICLEGQVTPRPDAVRTLETLRGRGILHSIASRGDETVALQTLHELQLLPYFIAPKINWLPKSTNILDIMRTLNLPPDAAAFIDDDPFEREQAAWMLPDTRVFAADQAASLPDLPGFDPGPLTPEAMNRDRLYREAEARKAAERDFASREEFLLSCGMELTVRHADAADVPRILELMKRTHQMNSTGLLPDEAEVRRMLADSGDVRCLYVAELRDRFGPCGIIGTVMTEILGTRWDIRLFAMSCRVMGRGVERAILSTLIGEAMARGSESIAASYRATDRNRMMRTMFQMSGFRQHEVHENGSLVFLLDHSQKTVCPSWVRLQ
jgi:methoxymalonate biosynthesis protein